MKKKTIKCPGCKDLKAKDRKKCHVCRGGGKITVWYDDDGKPFLCGKCLGNPRMVLGECTCKGTGMAIVYEGGKDLPEVNVQFKGFPW
jgi:hypothetical protein